MKPEGWLPISINREGWSQARAAADFLERYTRTRDHPRPQWGISSDLPRAAETLAIVAEFLHFPVVAPLRDLRAYEKKQESPLQYECRNHEAFREILDVARDLRQVPLIVVHKSSTTFLGKFHKVLSSDPDYENDALLLDGGIFAITDSGLKPLFRWIEANWPQTSTLKAAMSMPANCRN